MKMNFDDIIEKLYDYEKAEINRSNISTIEEFIPILLKRTPTTNVARLVNILKQSVIPTFYTENKEEDLKLDKLFELLSNNNESIFSTDIQQQLLEHIQKRIKQDKKIVIQKTSDISKLVCLMEEFLTEAIDSNGSGSKNVENIKSKLERIDMNSNNMDNLTDIHKELLGAATQIETEMKTVTNKLQTGKSEVQKLEEKIKDLEEELTKTKNESRHDHLTGLLTRRAFSEEIKRIESAFVRGNSPYAIVFFDIDHFKKINDTYGHKGGDVILSTFAKILSKHTRDHDIVTRYGGEEFVSIVHYNANKELLQYIKRIKNIVTQNSFVYDNKKIKVEFSAGVSIRENYKTFDEAIKKADELLYAAKESGRNKIVLENGMEM